MRVLITNVNTIQSKKGDTWKVLSYIAEDGATSQAWLTPEQYEKVPSDRILDSKKIKDLFDEVGSVDLQFNDKGRFVSAGQ